jgi:beta-fructofuranosidase
VNQPIAIYPEDNNHQVFSGCAVIDVNNTSGFFPDQDNGVVAIYTINESYGPQVQAIAYSVDAGYTFAPYEGNPVLTSGGSHQFRDPKVIWHAGTSKWVMVLAYAQEFAVGIFTSENLKNWTHASNFSHAGLLGLQYECPNMVEIPMEGSDDTMYLMTVSLNPGAPLGGSITTYFPGDFNGTHFTAVDSAARIADFGKDNYAGQFFYGIPGDQPQISIAWASNWQYTNLVPTGPQEGWRSAMSLPRHNYLKNITRVGWDLISVPYPLDPVLPSSSLASKTMGNDSVLLDFSTVESNALYFDINVTEIPKANISGSASLNFTFTSSITGESLLGGFFFAGDSTFWLNRGNIRGFDNPYFTDKFSTGHPLNTSSGLLRLNGVIDRSIFEVFLDDGERSATITFFPEQPLDTMIIKSGGLNEGMKVKAEVWGLESAWASEANDKGTVVGNVTRQVVKRDRIGEYGRWYY